MVMDFLKKIHAAGTTIVFATHDRDLFDLVPNARVIDIDLLHSPPTSL